MCKLELWTLLSSSKSLPKIEFFHIFSSWDDDPGTSTIERVRLSELDFPAITVCPEFASDKLATRTILNMSAETGKLVSCDTY